VTISQTIEINTGKKPPPEKPPIKAAIKRWVGFIAKARNKMPRKMRLREYNTIGRRPNRSDNKPNGTIRRILMVLWIVVMRLTSSKVAPKSKAYKTETAQVIDPVVTVRSGMI